MTALCRWREAGVQLLFLLGAAASLWSILAYPASAENRTRSQQFEFDIPRSTRVMALHELSRQAGGLLLGYLSTSTAEEEALVGPVKGRLSVEQVLSVVLRSSQLTFRWVEDSMVSVEPMPPSDAAAELNSVGVLRTLPHSSDFDPAKVGMPEEVMVVGWPMKDLALSGSPVVVMERSDLEAIAAPTLPDLLRYISQSAYSRPESYRGSGAQYAEMRGLGPDTALVLINGRRALPSANSIASSAFDLNTIPITAVERIEFLLDSASAPYGTDAIGGVINIILRDRIARPTVELRYGGAQGGAKQERVTLSGGWERDRVRTAMMFDYYKMGGLLGEERDLWRDQDFNRFGRRDLRTPISSPGNVFALAGNLPGLSQPFAAVPTSDATPGISIADFQATAGQLNLESLLRYSSVVPEATRATVTATGWARLNDSMTLSSDVLYAKRESTYHYGPPILAGLVWPAVAFVPTLPTNPYNPFGVPVMVYRLLTELPPQYQHVDSELKRAVLALRGNSGLWDWEVSALYSDERANTWLGNTLDMTATLAALTNSDPARVLNPFSAESLGSDALLDSLRAARDEDHFTSGGRQLAAFVQGPVLAVPAGSVSAIAGGEWRNENMQSLSGLNSSFDTDRNVSSAFTQLRVPLLGERMKIPGVHELALTAGVRWDRYSDFGSSLRYQGALLWRPTSAVHLRVSGSESFRPPSLYDLHLPRITSKASVSDPARGELATIDYITGGNPELAPATAKSMSAGVLYSPATAWNWQFSADWWRIDMQDRQVSVPLQTMLGNEGFFADRIVRDPAVTPDRPGTLRRVDTSRMNVGGVSASGVDLVIKADKQTDWGRITPGLQLTWFDKYRATDVPGQPMVERVNVASELGSVLAWRAVGSLKWRRGPFGAVMFARYTPSYEDAIAGVPTNRKIAAQTLWDVQASLDLGMLDRDKSALDGLKLWVGAVNVFDGEPSFADVGDAGGFDTSQAELRQRQFYIRLEQKF
ncbi:TonB-dependent receptor plug domain-containing protein [Steroidobacter sp.]|uniref:TonB-dependent receptor plug domain-containing protein n=1 Tax=Steroidobacter sp. TaxID=1978227 RepID=UPI001A582466|nr:TonB-dependent receptor [Steroidobacter sp.]MBL8271543.1 TonB-dependent receptor [Steroidobacter sp.]